MKKKGISAAIIIVLVVVFGVIIKLSTPHIIKNTNKNNFKGFNFKTVKSINYGNYNLEDYLKEEVSCDEDACTFQDFQIEYEFTEHNTLGNQKVELKLHYKDKDYKKTFNINIVDNEKPYINLSSKEIEVKLKSKFNIYDYIIEVYDNYDNDLMDKLIIDNPVDTKIKGDYIVTLSVEDSSGNKTSTKIKVKVVDEVHSLAPTKDNTDIEYRESMKIPSHSQSLLHETDSFKWEDIKIKIWSDNKKFTIKKYIKNFDKDISDSGQIYLSLNNNLNIYTNLLHDVSVQVNITDPDKETFNLKLNKDGYAKYTIDKLGVYDINITYKNEDKVFKYNYELLVKDDEKLEKVSYKLYNIKKIEFIRFNPNEGVSNLDYKVYIYETNDNKIELTENGYELKVINNIASFKYEAGKYYKIKAYITDKHNNTKILDFKIEK